jgi:hypothetical protein
MPGTIPDPSCATMVPTTKEQTKSRQRDLVPQEWIAGVARLDLARSPQAVPPHRWREFARVAGGQITSMWKDWALVGISGTDQVVHRRPTSANLVSAWRLR